MTIFWPLFWTVQRSESERSLKSTVLSQTGQSFEPKWTVVWAKVASHESKWTVFRLKMEGSNESKDNSGRSINVKVDGPEVWKGRSNSPIVDPNLWNSESERSKNCQIGYWQIELKRNWQNRLLFCLEAIWNQNTHQKTPRPKKYNRNITLNRTVSFLFTV